jgi:hypothetical protein
MSLTRDGLVGIGTASPDEKLTVTDGVIRLNSTTSTSRFIQFNDTAGIRHVIGSDASAGTNELGIRSEGQIVFGAGSGRGEAARIDASKRLLVGTSTARTNFFNLTNIGPALQVEGDGTANSSASLVRNSADSAPPSLILAKSRSTSYGVVSSGDALGRIPFMGADGSELVEAALIIAEVDGTPGSNDMPGRLVFSTTADGAASPTERLRITNGGSVFIGTTTATYPNPGIGLYPTGYAELGNNAGTAGTGFFGFARSNVLIGSITQSGTTGVAYNTSSDYRLKENVEPINGAVERILRLKPSRFNFIADPDRTVDGFIAHEAQAVVPEAIHGTKDEVDDDGNPVYQGIDQSKLVPLLTAALQEAIGRIETLEAEVAALKGA